jgi:hypothetical protein
MKKGNFYRINGKDYTCTGGYQNPYSFTYTFVGEKGEKFCIVEQTPEEADEEAASLESAS